MKIKADLHIHSCLSPCASLEMSPKRIVQELKAKNIMLAAITDHNSSLNCPSFSQLCKKEGIASLFGMEVQTAEEVHVLALFNDLDASLDFSSFIYKQIPEILNIPEKAGDQVYVDEDEIILGSVEKYLLTSISMNIDELVNEVHLRNGIIIPAHVNRPSFSLTSQFGLIPEGDWDALELANFEKNPPIDTKNYPLLFFSDAHFPSNIGEQYTILEVDDEFLTRKKIDLHELKKSFKQAQKFIS